MASEKPTAAFVLSLLAGIFITLRGGITSMVGSLIGGYRGSYGGYGYGGMMSGYNGYGYNGGYGGFGGMMNGYGFYGTMRGLGIGLGFIGVLGVVFGIIVIVSALMLYSHPGQHTAWGILIIVFSAMSMFGGGLFGLGVGLILGIVGGILAIVWKHPTPSTSHS